MNKIKKSLILSLVTFMTIFSSLSTTMPLFKLGLPSFIIINLVFILATFYFNWRGLGKLFDIEAIKSFVRRVLKGNFLEKFKITLSLLIAVAPAIAIYCNSLVYTHFFLVETLSMNSNFALAILQSILIPVSIIVSINLIKDLWVIINQATEFIKATIASAAKDISIHKLVIWFLSLTVSIYLAYWTTNISVAGINLYRLTFTDAISVSHVPTIIYFLLYLSALIMFTGIISYVLRNIYNYVSTSRAINIKDALLILCSCTKITISSVAAESRMSVVGIASLDGLHNFINCSDKIKEERSTPKNSATF